MPILLNDESEAICEGDKEKYLDENVSVED